MRAPENQAPWLRLDQALPAQAADTPAAGAR